jgi:hypothetical protein
MLVKDNVGREIDRQRKYNIWSGRKQLSVHARRRAFRVTFEYRPVLAESIGHSVPKYLFRIIRNGKFSSASDQGFQLSDDNAAWTEMTKVCGDLVGGVSRELKQNAEWQLELLDDSKKPLFRIRLVAETLA